MCHDIIDITYKRGEELMDSAYQQFMEWLKKQPAWLQDATWRIFNGKKIDNVQIGKYADMCIAQMKGDKVEPKCIDESVFSASDIRPVISVKSISEIVGVNALSDEAGFALRDGGNGNPEGAERDKQRERIVTGTDTGFGPSFP